MVGLLSKMMMKIRSLGIAYLLLGISFMYISTSAEETNIIQSEGYETVSEVDVEQGEENIISNESSENTILQLDSNNIYSGMKKAYKDGYVPTISKNEVKIVLPVYFYNRPEINEIETRLDLGVTEGTPFEYKNYSKTIKKTEEKIKNSDKKQEIFLIKYTLKLNENAVNGIYPVVVSANYTVDGESFCQEFSVYVNITNRESGGNSEIVAEDTLRTNEVVDNQSTSDPKVIIVKSDFSTDKILSGSDFKSVITLKNTNKNKYIQNITVTVGCEEKGISLIGDSNVFYFEKLDANSTLELPLSFHVSDDTIEGKYSITFSISYDNPNATQLTAEGSVNFIVYQSMRVAMETGKMISEICAGDSIVLPIQIMNLGRGTVYNVRCTVEGTGLSETKSLFFGNLEGGTAETGELNMFANAVNPEASEENERYGDAYGVIKMIYEDAEGNEYTEQQSYHIKILPMVINTNVSDEDKEEENTIGVQLIAGTIIVLALFMVAIILPIVIRKCKQKIEMVRNFEGDNGNKDILCK